ncbi:cold-shock protein [Kushneria aurantia]|uniref:Cold-shock protein n=1 Tax=Kushneria aurantia TaxID=504092 RepID=A0ABV6G6C8_9GAMM|nr:cold shock domain-containing protein [Kushneria aurantia]
MSAKTVWRCTFISLLLALAMPLLAGFFLYIASPSALAALGGSPGIVSTWALVSMAAFIVLEIATLVMHILTPALSNVVDVENDDREIGVVKWFNVNKGYGFIARDGGEDVFVHFRAIRGKGHRTLAEGQRVRYHSVQNERGLQAEDVTVIT